MTFSGIFTSYDMAKTFTEGQNYVIAHDKDALKSLYDDLEKQM